MKTPFGKRHLIAFFLLVGFAALSLATWSWRQSTRPGRVHFERGLDFAAAKQMSQAEQEWLAGVRQDPGFPDNYAQLGDLYSALGQFPQAAAQYEAAIKLTPNDGTLFLRLARADEAAGRHEAALTAASRAASLRPEDAEALGYYGILAAKLNRPETALPPLTHAHAHVPDDADDLIYLARVEIQLHDLSGAERDLTPFVQRHPDNAEACYLMAYLWDQKPQAPGVLQTALDYARRAQAGAPGNADANILLGQILLEAGQPAQALPAFRQAQVLSPNSVPTLHGLLRCYTILGWHVQAARTKAALDATQSRWVHMGHASDLLLANPSDIAALLEMARLREENGDRALALSYYRQAAHQAPQDARAQAALDGFLRRRGGHTLGQLSP